MSRMPRAFLFGLLGLSLCFHLPTDLSAEAPSPPPYFAIRDARVVVGNGQSLERASVLISNGLIEAVGTDLPIPADAWVLDGTGLSVYPGLVDAWSGLGQKKDDEEKGGGRGGSDSDAPPIRGPQDRPKTTPWLRGSETLAEELDFEKWRQAGFTSTVTVPQKGIFAGQASWLNLGDGEVKELVVSASVAQRVSFERGGWREYPSSLMGVIAYIRQVFEDARYYEWSRTTYEKDPKGRVRPEHDPTLHPLVESMGMRQPFVFSANLGREIDRVLILGGDHGLRTVVLGGQGAYSRVENLKEADAAVLVDVNWPEEKKNRDPEADTPIRTLIHRELAPTTPAALSAAGVPFAFSSDGLSSGEVLEGVRTAIDAGLDEMAALRALSLTPAEIFGLDDRLGSIERGKIANLVVASDWPWAEDTEVSAVFVDGLLYRERKKEEEHEVPAQDVSGTWAIVLETPGGAREMTADLEMAEDGKVKGEIVSEMGTTKLDDARMSGERLRFETTREMRGRSMTAKWTLTVEGESLEGSMSAGPMSMEVKGERTAQATAKSSDDEGDDDAEAVPHEELLAALSVVQGKAREMDRYAITNAEVWTVSGETLSQGTVLVQEGKIRAVGKDLDIPSGYEVIDAQGGALIPGIIDCHSHIAVDGGVNEGTIAVSSMVAIGDVVNADHIAIYRALAGGVTSANLLHGSSNPIGGTNRVVKLRWGAVAAGMEFQGAPKGIKFALGENPTGANSRSFGGTQRYPQTRLGVMDVIRQAFTDARAYQLAWDAYEKGEKTRAGVKAARPRRDLQLEPLVEILEGERLIHAHCYRADEILQLMRLAEEFGFRIGTLQHVLEGYKVADEIAAHGAGASTFSDWWGYKIEAYEAIPQNAALMTERGVLVSINSDSGEEMRHLNQEAAKSVRWGGMDEIAALAMVTLNPAIQLGIDDRVGSIEVGKDADLVLYDGHPLAIGSVVQMTFVDGDLYFDLEADRARQSYIDALKKRLSGKDGSEAGADEDESPAGGSKPPPQVHWSPQEHYSCQEVK